MINALSLLALGAAALQRRGRGAAGRKLALRVCGHWPATARQINDAIASRPSALTVPVPANEKPSQKLARLAREAQARRFEAWRNEQRGR